MALAERVFTRHGVWAVFFGRFIALLRIFAGPLAGSLRMPYVRFLAANASGGIVWAAGITYLIWFLGLAAETVDVPVVLARAGRGGPGRPGDDAARSGGRPGR